MTRNQQSRPGGGGLCQMVLDRDDQNYTNIMPIDSDTVCACIDLKRKFVWL